MKSNSFSILTLVLAVALCVNGNIFTSLVEWVEGPPGKIVVDSLGDHQDIWSLISNTASGNVSIKTFTVNGWFNQLDIFSGAFPITGLEGVLVNGDAGTGDPCEYIPPHPDETIAEILSEIVQDESGNVTLKNNTWFLVVSITDKDCNYDHVLTMAEEAGYRSVIFRNLLVNDTASAPSSYSGNISSVFAWSIGDHDGLELQEEYSYPNSVSARLFDLRLLRYTLKVGKIIGLCFGGGAVVAAATTATVVVVVKKRRAAAAAAAATTDASPGEKTPLLSPTFVESPSTPKKPDKPGLSDIFTTASVSPSQLSEKLQESTTESLSRKSSKSSEPAVEAIPPAPDPEPEQKPPESEDEYTEEECTICAIMLGLTTPHKHRVLKKPKRSRQIDPSRRYRTQVSVPAPDSVAALPNPIPPLQRTSSLLSPSERVRTPPIGTEFTRLINSEAPSAFKPLRNQTAAPVIGSNPPGASAFKRRRSVSFKEDDKSKSKEQELTSSFQKNEYTPTPVLNQTPLAPFSGQIVPPGPGLTQISNNDTEHDRNRHESEEELAQYFKNT